MLDLPLARHAQLIADRIENLQSLNLPILVLFTSKELLLEVSERLTVSHLAQYKNGEASNIKRRFDRGEASILLGTGSFWEGTDFRASWVRASSTLKSRLDACSCPEQIGRAHV